MLYVLCNVNISMISFLFQSIGCEWSLLSFIRTWRDLQRVVLLMRDLMEVALRRCPTPVMQNMSSAQFAGNLCFPNLISFITWPPITVSRWSLCAKFANNSFRPVKFKHTRSGVRGHMCVLIVVPPLLCHPTSNDTFIGNILRISDRYVIFVVKIFRLHGRCLNTNVYIEVSCFSRTPFTSRRTTTFVWTLRCFIRPKMALPNASRFSSCLCRTVW